MAELKPGEVEPFETRLRARREALRAILHTELLATRREEYQDLAGQVHDIGDESVAEMLMGVDLKGRQREFEEMQDVEDALERIKDGSFGICVDCGRSIEMERLGANPTARRCIFDQERYEQRQNGGKDGTPSL